MYDGEVGEEIRPFSQMEDAYVAAEKKASYRRTLAIQVALCLALYAAFHIGTPQPPSSSSSAGGGTARFARNPADIFFISVRGGARTPSEESQLLRQMDRTAKIYGAKFVVNIAEHGDRDPLLQNASSLFSSEIPWYTTGSHGQMIGNLFKKMEVPYEQALDLVAVDTGSLQVLFSEEALNRNVSNGINCLQRIVATSSSNWHIAVGFDPLVICDEKEGAEIIKFNKRLHNIFLESGMDVYLSKQGCAGYFYHDDGITYIGHPGPADQMNKALSINVNPDAFRQVGFLGEMRNGFLLHRVSPLEIESYFIDFTGKKVIKSMNHHRGRGAI